MSPAGFLARFAVALVGWNFLPPEDAPAEVARPVANFGSVASDLPTGGWSEAPHSGEVER